MTRRSWMVLVAAAVVVVACANGTSTGASSGDLADASSGGPRKDGGGGDDGPPGACTLGTPTDCGACGKACPGPDDKTTVRTCNGADENGKCDLLCRGEFYDLDGKPENGCEAEDPTVQDTTSNAAPITLQNVATPDPMFKTNPMNVVAPLYGDARNHESAPTTRPFGRDDVFAVTAVGAGIAGLGMTACLSAVNFPTDNELEVCITSAGGTTFDTCKPLVITTDGGGGSVCVSPVGTPTPDSGLFYVRVRRTKGTSNANEYALFLQH